MECHPDKAASNGRSSNGSQNGSSEKKPEQRSSLEFESSSNMDRRIVSLYAGVGIVRGSDAASEWQVSWLNGHLSPQSCPLKACTLSMTAQREIVNKLKVFWK